MVSLLKFNSILYLTNRKVLFSTLALVFFLVLGLSSLHISELNEDGISKSFILEVDILFDYFNFFVIVLFPFLFLFFLNLDSKADLNERINAIPYTKNMQIYAKLLVYLGVLCILIICFLSILEWKCYIKNVESVASGVVRKNLFIYFVFTIPYMYFIISLFYYFKNFIVLLILHFSLSIFGFFETFFWLPNSWGSHVVHGNLFSALGINLTFYVLHPINFFYLFFVIFIIVIEVFNRTFQNDKS